MPADFERCVIEKGRVRTVSGPDKEHGLKEGEYVKYCYKDGKSYRGEIKKLKASEFKLKTFSPLVKLGKKFTEKTSEIEVLEEGRWDHPDYGVIEITGVDLDRFLDSFNEKIRKIDIAVDQEHQPERGAAGWFKELKKVYEKGKEKLKAVIEWTPVGQELIKNGIFKYFSPEFEFEYEDYETHEKFDNVLLGGALTNRPYFKNLAPVQLSENIFAGFELAEWDTTYINDLPDSSFAIILPGGEKDAEDKTTPRSLRKLPYKNKEDKVDLPHLRNALARVNQPKTDLTPTQRTTAKRKLEVAAKEHLESHKEATELYRELILSEGGEKEMTKEELKAKLAEDPEFKLGDAATDEEKVAYEEAKQEIEEEAKDAEKAEEGKEEIQAIEKRHAKEMNELRSQLGIVEKRLRFKEVEEDVRGYTFSESNPDGVLLPKSKDATRDLIMSLNSKQAALFNGFLKTLPKISSMMFEEIGEGDDKKTLEPSEEFDKKVLEFMEKDKGLTYSQAARKVAEANPELAKKLT